MATPEDRPAPSEVQWAPDSTYRPTDNDGQHVCAMTGYRQRPGERVYRGPFIDEFYGFFAIGQDAAEDLARLIGWVDPDEQPGPDEAMVEENWRLKAEVEALRATVANIEQTLGVEHA